MASERRTCQKPTCHRKYSRPLGSRRIFCEECSPPRERRSAPEVTAPAQRGFVRMPPGDLEASVRAELERTDRADTWRGQVAVRLAREAEGASGTAVSSLLKQLEAAMAAALDGVPPEPDFVDDLAARRNAQTA